MRIRGMSKDALRGLSEFSDCEFEAYRHPPRTSSREASRKRCISKDGPGRRPCKPQSFETQAFARGQRLAPQDEAREPGNDWFHGIDRRVAMMQALTDRAS